MTLSVVQCIPPTTYLPPIARLTSYKLSQLLDSLGYLRLLYNPEVRGSRRKPSDSHLKYLSTSSIIPEIDLIRSDAFERTYAIRWLTTLISRYEILYADEDAPAIPDASLTTPADPSLSQGMNQLLLLNGPPLPNQKEAEKLLQEAASLLAMCAGAAAAGEFSRTFIFGHEASSQPDGLCPGKVEVQLTDLPLENNDYQSIGAQTWGGACVMAEMIVETPSNFGLVNDDALGGGRGREDFRVLELGAGTGLVSLTLAKVISKLPGWISADNVSGQTKATVVATDFYPSVLANLQSNIRANFPSPSNTDTPSTRIITSHFLDWSKVSKSTSPATDGRGYPDLESSNELDVLSRPFDLILGADIVYESQHAAWIKACVEKFLRRSKPMYSNVHPQSMDKKERTGTDPPMFHLIIPLRSTHTIESNTIEEVFKFSTPLTKIDQKPGVQGEAFSDTPELVILSKQTILCEADPSFTPITANGNGAAAGDEVEYVYYKVGWSPGRIIL